MGKEGLLVLKDGIMRESCLSSRLKEREFLHLNQLVIVMRGNGKEIFRMEKVVKHGLVQALLLLTKDNMLAARSMAKESTKAGMNGNMRENFQIMN